MTLEPWHVDSALLALHNIADAVGDGVMLLGLLVAFYALGSNSRRVTIAKDERKP